MQLTMSCVRERWEWIAVDEVDRCEREHCGELRYEVRFVGQVPIALVRVISRDGGQNSSIGK